MLLGKTSWKFWIVAIFFKLTSLFIYIEDNNKYPWLSLSKGSLTELVGDFKIFSKVENIIGIFYTI